MVVVGCWVVVVVGCWVVVVVGGWVVLNVVVDIIYLSFNKAATLLMNVTQT